MFVSPTLFSSAVVMGRARFTGRLAAVWVQDIYSLGMTGTRGSSGSLSVAAFVAAVESAVLPQAHGVVVIDDRFIRAVERLGASRGRVKVVRNWTHLHGRLGEEAPPQQIRKRMGSGDEVVVPHSGAIGHKQDLDNVVRAARLAAEDGSAVRSVLMGNGGERARLERLAAELLTIDFLDPLRGDGFQGALGAADVLLVNEHPGLREMAVPSNFTSYFSSGRPVVAATACGSVTAQEVEASQGGVRVDPGAPLALLDAVVKVGSNPDRANRLGRAASSTSGPCSPRRSRSTGSQPG